MAKTDLLSLKEITKLQKRAEELRIKSLSPTDNFIDVQESIRAQNILASVLHEALEHYEQLGKLDNIPFNMLHKKYNAEGRSLFKLFTPVDYKIGNCSIFKFTDNPLCELKYVAVYGNKDKIEGVVHVDDLNELEPIK